MQKEKLHFPVIGILGFVLLAVIGWHIYDQLHSWHEDESGSVILSKDATKELGFDLMHYTVWRWGAGRKLALGLGSNSMVIVFLRGDYALPYKKVYIAGKGEKVIVVAGSDGVEHVIPHFFIPYEASGALIQYLEEHQGRLQRSYVECVTRFMGEVRTNTQ